MKRVPETEIGRAVVRWLQADHWTVWQEVGTYSGGPVCDAVARRGPLVHAIECKTVANIDVLEQAEQWIGQAHLVSVAVPLRRKDALYTKLARSLGIGVIWTTPGTGDVDVVKWFQGPYFRVREEKWHRPLSHYLTDASLAWGAEAGNNRSERYTPFRASCVELLRVVTASPGITIRDAVEQMREHHYSSDKAARASLSQWVRHGKVPGVVTAREWTTRAITLYPEGHPDLGGGADL